MRVRLEGSFPAVVTPFRDGSLDEPSLRGILRFLLKGGSAGLVLSGSTGEAATLTPGEYARVVRLGVEEAGGRVPVIAGVGANATWRAVDEAKRAQALGADAILLLAPCYNKPTQEGLFRHFREAARAVRVPVILYNIPGRAAVNVKPGTMARVAAACRNVVGVKEASGDLDQVSEIVRTAPKGFTVLSGDDSLTLPMMALGAKGVVSVLADVAPRQTAAMAAAALKGDFDRARRLHLKLFGLIQALFIETNPIPVKAASAMLGLCTEEMRLPLTPLTAKSRPVLRAALKSAGLL